MYQLFVSEPQPEAVPQPLNLSGVQRDSPYSRPQRKESEYHLVLIQLPLVQAPTGSTPSTTSSSGINGNIRSNSYVVLQLRSLYPPEDEDDDDFLELKCYIVDTVMPLLPRRSMSYVK